jgi:adenine-specific DNA-methyltransferase
VLQDEKRERVGPFAGRALTTKPAPRPPSTLFADSIKLIIAAPPYSLSSTEGGFGVPDEYLKEQAETAKECVRLLHPKGSICWQTGSVIRRGEAFPLDIFIYPIFKELGLKLRNRIIWCFPHGLRCHRRFSKSYETILWFTKTDSYTFHPDQSLSCDYFPCPTEKAVYSRGGSPGDVWILPDAGEEQINSGSQLPAEVIEWLILSMTEPGDKVLDPYTSSAAAVALKHGRSGYRCAGTPAFYFEI